MIQRQEKYQSEFQPQPNSNRMGSALMYMALAQNVANCTKTNFRFSRAKVVLSSVTCALAGQAL